MYNTSVKNNVNSYFAILIIAIAGALATRLIVHVATENTLTATVSGNEASYAQLRQSILSQ
ncbi:MAG: hypothetical protein G01um101449_444 [Parcubacteria group bacterium Gr01-1014_49]|nr:MAG: hypothetical protein G01um101449_444 [Parcubacteria group bacterium Gr01-1014_49]